MATQTEDVVLLIPEEKCPEWTNAVSSCVDLKMLKNPVRISTIETCGASPKQDILKIFRPELSTVNGKNLMENILANSLHWLGVINKVLGHSNTLAISFSGLHT